MQFPGFTTIYDLHREADTVRQRAYGMIEMREETLRRVQFRPWPFRITTVEASWLGRWRHEHQSGNHCRLYFNQPRGCPEYLSLTYVESTRETTLATFRGALAVLDEIAGLKGSEAIVCEAFNPRISDRLMQRWGWSQHCQHLSGRHFIKRFDRPHSNWAERLVLERSDLHQVDPV